MAERYLLAPQGQERLAGVVTNRLVLSGGLFAPAGRVGSMRCPYCANVEDKVIDSRATDEGTAIRRRRECLACGRRFTTYERLEEVSLTVVKRSGQRVSFERAKIVEGVKAASKNRPVSLEQMEDLAAEVEEALRGTAQGAGQEVSSQEIGLAVLERLRSLDEVAYLRFASVYKGFSGAVDFQREAVKLTKSTSPKLPSAAPPPPSPSG